MSKGVGEMVRSRSVQVKASAGTEGARRAIGVPADGAALFGFLLREIPDVVSQLPCVCCSEVLEGCYQGACPPS